MYDDCYRFEDDVIEERRRCTVMLLEFIGNHPPLFTSTVFVKFFEVSIFLFYYLLMNFYINILYGIKLPAEGTY